MTRPKRTLALVSIVDPESLAESLAAALGGRLAALELLEAAVAVLRGKP